MSLAFDPRAAGALLAVACACTPFAAANASPQASLRIDMTAERWQSDGELAFRKDAAHRGGVMTVKKGGAILKDLDFASGTIEYDLDEADDNQGIAGIWFRQQGTESAENVYLRTDADCPRSVECIQYAPVSHRQVQWEVYPQYEAAAPVKAHGWNHVRLVVSGRRMDVFVNGEAAPSLRVGELAGDAASGRIQLRGDAAFANLVITPDAVDGLPPEAVPDPTAADARFVRRWSVSPVASLARGATPTWDAMPPDTAAWEPLAAERGGFVNLARRHGTARGVPDLAWLKTRIISASPQTKHVALGWGHEIWVYVNRRLVFADDNRYYPASGRKPPLGRVALENGAFDLPLEAGLNEIEIAISNDLGSNSHWGWGFEMRLDDIDGLRLDVVPATM